MANTCKTCRRKDVDAINKALLSEEPLRNIVVQFGATNIANLQRHKEHCLELLFAEVREQKRAGLLADVDDIRKEIIEVKTQFADNGNVRTGLISKMIDVVNVEAKLTGAFIKDAENPADLKSVAKIVADFRERIKRDADIYAETNGKYGYAMPDDNFVDAEIEKLCRLHKVKPEQIATLDLGGIG